MWATRAHPKLEHLVNVEDWSVKYIVLDIKIWDRNNFIFSIIAYAVFLKEYPTDDRVLKVEKF